MKLTSGTTLGNLAIPNAKNLSQFYGSGGQMSKGRVAPSLKAYGGMVSDYMMDNIALPLKGLPQKRMARGGKHMMLNSAHKGRVAPLKAKGGKVSKLKRGGVF